MGVEDKELFYSPEHRDRKDLHGYEIDDIFEVVQLKAYLRRERQIAETRLKAIEQRDEIIAALSANRAQTDEGRLEALESRLNSEIRDRSELTGQLQQYHAQVEEYKSTLRRITAKIEALVKREVWRLPEHLRPPPLQGHGDDASPSAFLSSTAVLLERLNAVVNQVLEVSRAEIEKALSDTSNADRWKKLVQEKEADVAQAQLNITALKATNKLFENNIKVAEAQARSLQEALDQAHEAAEKDAETFQTLKTMLDVAQSRNNELSATCDYLKRQLKESHERETSSNSELRQLRELLAAQTSRSNPITITPSQDLSVSNGEVEVHEITSTEEHVTYTEVTMTEIPDDNPSDASTRAREFVDAVANDPNRTVSELFYTARNSRDDAEAARETVAMSNRPGRTTRKKKQQSPSELISGETMATETRADGSSSIGTSPDSMANTVRATRSKKPSTEHMTLRAVGTPPRRRTRRAAI